MYASSPMNCSALVPSPVDAAPIRSPQAVHTALLRHFADREVIEIGTRNGDGMACFSQHTRNATAINLDPKYCDVLRQRSEVLRQAGGRGFEVLCSDYRKTAHLDVRASIHKHIRFTEHYLTYHPARSPHAAAAS